MMRSTGSPNTKREILPSSSNITAFNAKCEREHTPDDEEPAENGDNGAKGAVHRRRVTDLLGQVELADDVEQGQHRRDHRRARKRRARIVGRAGRAMYSTDHSTK